MSNKPQDTQMVRSILILVVVAIIGATGWYVLRSKDEVDKTTDTNKTTQSDNKDTEKKPDAYEGWKSYTWESQGVTFKHPGDWFVQENTSLSRLYVKNTQVDLTKEETPANFQQIW